MSQHVVEFSDANFDAEVLKSSTPVLVDFWAPWCGPCRMLAPLIEEMGAKYTGAIKVGKLNIDDSPNAASRYNVMSIPTLIVFKGGNIVNTMVGVPARQKLEGALEAAKG